MGFFKKLKYGKIGVDTQSIIRNDFGIEPVHDDMMQMCFGLGVVAVDGHANPLEPMADYLNAYEMATFYVGNYWVFGSSERDIKLIKQAKNAIDKFYSTGRAKSPGARKEFDRLFQVLYSGFLKN